MSKGPHHDLLAPAASRQPKATLPAPSKKQAPQDAVSAAPESQASWGARAANFSQVPGPTLDVHEVLRSSGESLDPATRADMSRRLRYDFGQVKIHRDAKAAESAEKLDAQAYTVGRNVVFGKGKYSPGGGQGKELLAHELTHVKQQDGARPGRVIPVRDDPAMESDAQRASAGFPYHQDGKTPDTSTAILQRTPVRPTGTGGPTPFDRSLVMIDDINDVSGVTTGTVAKQTIGVAINAPGAVQMTWELYNGADAFVDGISTMPSNPKALSQSFVIDQTMLKRNLSEGRYTLRCIARNQGNTFAYADQTFYVWAATPLAKAGRPALANVLNAASSHSLGELGAAKARDMMLEHQEQLAKTGTGTLMGNQCPGNAAAGVAKSDCTQYVYDILKFAFGAKGSATVWNAVAKKAAQLSGPGGLRGTALQSALETEAGWKGVFWAPSPRNPEDGKPEHPAAFKQAKKKGTYSADNGAVEKDKSIVDYRPKSPKREGDFTRLDQLKKVPLGVISARGGTHMTLLLSGQVYEVHWDKPATDPDVIEATPLEKWEWESGAIVMPPESYNAAIGRP